MHRIQDLNNALRERHEHLAAVPARTFINEARSTVAWISQQRLLAAILADAEARAAEPLPDIEEWLETAGAKLDANIFPTSTDPGRAAFAWRLLQFIATLPDDVPFIIADKITTSILGNGRDRTRELTEVVLSPLFHYLADHLTDTSAGLYTLSRYKARVE